MLKCRVRRCLNVVYVTLKCRVRRRLNIVYMKTCVYWLRFRHKYIKMYAIFVQIYNTRMTLPGAFLIIFFADIR